MRSIPRLRDLYPLQLLQTRFPYQRLPTASSASDSGHESPGGLSGFQWPAIPARLQKWIWYVRTHVTITRVLGLTIALFVFRALLHGQAYDSKEQAVEEARGVAFHWQEYSWLKGYYNGVRTLVPYSQYDAENRYNKSAPPVGLTKEEMSRLSPMPALNPVRFNPYPDYSSSEYKQRHHEVRACYLDERESIPAPDVYAYPGLPQHLPKPLYGSYKELGLASDICFDRFGRLGPYGFGRNESMGKNGMGAQSESFGSEKIFEQVGDIDYTRVDWGAAQQRCFEKNHARFDEQLDSAKERTKRHALVLRTWTGYDYSEAQVYTLRAMVNELSLKSGGEYDVHFLVHVKDRTLPIWADPDLYRQTLEENIPREFRNISTLWSESQMTMYYPGPFGDNFAGMVESKIHGAYRSPHFPLQWFSQQHPEYDFFWNWEMDVRYTGHYYELASRIGEWARKQPRKGLWERSSRFWFPQWHGDYKKFSEFVEKEMHEVDIPKNDERVSGPMPIWGPVQDFEHHQMLAPPKDTTPPTSYEDDKYAWGVGEDADLLTFNPLFDPSRTNWVFRQDATGYNISAQIPPRRAAIITHSRLSKRLLNIMHEETWRMKHSMFPEMWSASVSLHHGLKAAYVPHPVYFTHDWNMEEMDQAFNYPKAVWASPFGWGENNLLGSTFYYNSRFAGSLWRRWLGQKDSVGQVGQDAEGGRLEEEVGTGRMCLRGVLLHPVKHEASPWD